MEVYLLFVYVTLLFAVFEAAELLQQTFHCAFQTSCTLFPPFHYFASLLFSRSPIPSFSMCGSSRGEIDEGPFCTGHSKVVDRPVALVALPWVRVVCFTEVVECHCERRGRRSRAVSHGGLVDWEQS